MKKLRLALVLALSIMMVAMFCACGSQEPAEEETTQIANPITEVASADELTEATGISIDAPEGSENVAYSWISVDGENPIAQVVFTRDGKVFTYRAQAVGNTDILELAEDADADITGFEPENTIGGKLSGIYNEWTCGVTTVVADRDAVAGWDDGDMGFISWLDTVPGVLYSLSVDSGATQQLLEETAADVFVPVQGED